MGIITCILHLDILSRLLDPLFSFSVALGFGRAQNLINLLDVA